MFQCDKCGCCCRNLQLSSIYEDLHSGDGICFHFNRDSKLCDIYETRPLICRIKEGYEIYFPDNISWSSYLEQTKEACRRLQAMTSE